MTLYQKPQFSVPASSPSREECEPGKHPMADKRGQCLRCGKQIRDVNMVAVDDA